MSGSRRWLWLLLVALLVWGGWIVARSTVVVAGHRYSCLFDDAMISMTYARNLVDGKGLVWARQGAPVEGFTHPLWLLPMIASNLLVPSLAWRSLPMQGLSLFLLVATAYATWRLVRTRFALPGAAHALPAAALTGFFFPLAYWSLLGMETALQAFLGVICVQLALDAVWEHRERHVSLWLAGAAAYLLRMDMLLLVAVVQAYVVLRGGVRGAAGWRRWLLGLALFVAAAGGYEIFRWVYFHDLLPNTYYLKMTGVPLVVRLHRGVVCVGGFAARHALLLVLAAASLLAWRRQRGILLPAAVFATYAAYVAWVGGDAWENIGIRADRFLSFAVPLLFVVVNAGWNAAVATWRQRNAVAEDASPAPQRWNALAAVATLLLLVVGNGAWPWGAGIDQLRWIAGLDRPPMVDRHERVLERLVDFQRQFPTDALVAVAWAGIPAFFSDYRLVDLLGYNDRELAHGPPPQPIDAAHWERFWPGHNKWNVEASLARRPDAYFQVWGPRVLGLRVKDVMEAHGYVEHGAFWLRADSPLVSGQPGAPGTTPQRGRHHHRSPAA
jgi:hypothetical protein